MIALGRRRYRQGFDAMAMEAWFRNTVLKQPLIWLYVRLDDAFMLGVINVIPWVPGELEFTVIMVVADEGKMWQAVELLRFSIEWSRQRRIVDWRLSSETENELGAIAKRLGATELSPRYSLRLV